MHFIEGSKYRAETVSIVLSFSDLMQPGDTITGVPVVTVVVFAGIDPSPSDILFQGVTVTGGNTTEQRFRLGITGTIYTINTSIHTTAGDFFEKDCYLAIILDDDNAVPTFLPFWETTQLYPIQPMEQIQGNITFNSGTLRQTVFPIGPESIQGIMVFQGGTFTQVGITYHNPHEDLQGNIIFIGGTLIGVGILYNNVHEDIQGNIAFISGTLIGVGISYHNPHEDIQGGITFIGGTLV